MRAISLGARLKLGHTFHKNFNRSLQNLIPTIVFTNISAKLCNVVTCTVASIINSDELTPLLSLELSSTLLQQCCRCREYKSN